MAIPSQFLPLPIGQGGYSQKTDPRWVDAPAQTTLVNVRMVKAGAFSKRWGFSKLGLNSPDNVYQYFGSTNGSYRGIRLLGFGSQLLEVAEGASGGSMGGATRLLSSSTQVSGWSNLDCANDCLAYRTPIIEWSNTTNTYDCAYGGGFLVTCYTALPYSSSTIYQVYVSVQQWSNGAFIIKNYLVSAAGANTPTARCIVVSKSGVNYAIFVWYDLAATTDIWAQSLNLSNMTWGTATKIINNFDAAADKRSFDICALTDDAWAIVFPRNDAGTKTTKLIQFTVAFATTASATYGPPAAHNSPGHGYAICGDSSTIATCVAYDDGGNTHLYVRWVNTTTLTNVLVETDLQVNYVGTANGIRIGMCKNLASTTSALVATSNRTSTVGTRWRTMNSAGTRGTTRIAYNYDLASKPTSMTTVNGNVYSMAWLAYNGNLVGYSAVSSIQTVSTNPQGTYELVHLNENGTLVDGTTSSSTSTGRALATIAPRVANTVFSGTSPWSNTMCTGFPTIDTSTYVSVGSMAGSTSTKFSLQAMVASFTGDRCSSVLLGDSLYIAGGVPMVFDGLTTCSEVGFLHPHPGALSLSPSAGAGALSSSTTYGYLVHYERTTARGEVVRSAASVGTVAMGAADNTVTITLNHNTLCLAQDIENNFSPAQIHKIYRTTAGPGATYYLLADATSTAIDPQNYSTTYVDLVSDSALTALGLGTWPFAANQVEPQCPGAIQKFVVYGNRLFGIGDDRKTLVYSTAYVIGEQVRFNDLFRINIPDIATGLEVLDGTLYVFTADKIYRLAGHGPTEQGTDNDFGNLQIVAGDVGCIEPRSLITTQAGIFFQSAQGISCLTRGGEPIYIGASVEDELATYPTIVAATLAADETEIRFECQSSDKLSGQTINYQYYFKAWTVSRRWNSDTSTAAAPAYSSIVVDKKYYWLTKEGVVYQENTDATAAGAFLDDGKWIELRVKSALAKAAGLTGWAMWRGIQIAGESMSHHNLNVNVITNYGNSDLETLKASEIDSWSDNLELAEIEVADIRSPVLQVEIYDSAPDLSVGTGEGLKLLGLQVETAMTGKYRFPREQTA